MKTAIWFVLYRLLLMILNETSWPDHHWSPENDTSILDDGFTFFKRSLCSCWWNRANQHTTSFTYYRKLAPTIWWFQTYRFDVSLIFTTFDCLINGHISSINLKFFLNFVKNFQVLPLRYYLAEALKSDSVCLISNAELNYVRVSSVWKFSRGSSVSFGSAAR